MRWLLKFKRWKTWQDWIRRADKHRHSSSDILLKKEELNERFLKADREEDNDMVIRTHAQIEVLDWIIGSRATLIVLFLLLPMVAFGQEVIIRDKTTTGYKAEVDKVGADYGLSTVIHSKKYMICNKDDDATPNYYGFEAADGSWYILKWTVSAGADVFAYDSGTSAYSTAWTNRASGVYQSWSSEF